MPQRARPPRRPRSEHAGPPVAIRAGRVVPGAGAPVVSPGLVVLDGSHIRSVRDGRTAPPAGAEVVDLGDATVIPGLIDAHVHLCFDASADVLTPLQQDDDATLVELMRVNATKMLDAGITTARDLGDRNYLSLALRDELGDGDNRAKGPELLVAGPPITRRGGHCWFLGGEADGDDELRAAVHERADRGCDVVKVMATGGVLTPGFLPDESQYDEAEIRVIVETAAGRGLAVAAHAHGGAGIRDSVNAGVASVEHCSFVDGDIDWEVMERMAASAITASATLATLPGATPPPVIAAGIARWVAQIPRMRAIGVPLVCSSDAGIAPPKPHDVLPHGVVEFVRVGLDPASAIHTVTTAAADACGVGDRKGRLAPGYDADILALDGNPLDDIEAILRPVAVFRGGQRVR